MSQEARSNSNLESNLQHSELQNIELIITHPIISINSQDIQKKRDSEKNGEEILSSLPSMMLHEIKEKIIKDSVEKFLSPDFYRIIEELKAKKLDTEEIKLDPQLKREFEKGPKELGEKEKLKYSEYIASLYNLIIPAPNVDGKEDRPVVGKTSDNEDDLDFGAV